MACTCVVGLQWGDEAKGKIVDLLGDDHDFVVRYNGGANAGHTIVWGDRKFKLSLVPTGILRPNLKAVIGNGVVVGPAQLLQEIEQLRGGGISIGANLALSNHAHVIFPYHLEEEKLSEQSGVTAIGTTNRGIGPCYQDKAGRVCAIRVGELLDPVGLRERLATVVPRKNRMLAALAGGQPYTAFDADALHRDYCAFAEQLRPFVTETGHLLRQAIKQGKRVLFEAAQGSLLDVDHGTYPYVTSSNSSPAGIWSGSGVPARALTRMVGVIKAYCTRVGRGPFPTELDDGDQMRNDVGTGIRERGHEYGTVTGRPRRVGWFDAVAARYSAELAGADELTLMLLDVLSGVPELPVCTAYEVDGERTDVFPADVRTLAKCEPVYETLPGWTADVSAARKPGDLPAAARRYVDRLGELLGVRVSVVSVGPDREQTIVC
jgi:adenylosuccinate synthase